MENSAVVILINFSYKKTFYVYIQNAINMANEYPNIFGMAEDAK